MINDYLNRNIFSLVYEFDPSDNNQLARIMDIKGSSVLQDELMEEAQLDQNRIIFIINTIVEKQPRLQLMYLPLKNSFYNVKQTKLEPIDIDLSRLFSPLKKYRIYRK